MSASCCSSFFESRDLQVILSFLSVDNKKPRSSLRERGFLSSDILSADLLHFFFIRPAVDGRVEGYILSGENLPIENQ